MSELLTWSDLREAAVRKGWGYYSVLLPQDKGSHDPETCFVVDYLAEGAVEVTVTERGTVNFREVYADERTAVATLDAMMTSVVPVGPPLSEEQIDRSKARQEASRQVMIAKLPPERRKELGF